MASSEDEDSSYEYEHELTLQSIGKSITLKFLIHADYTDWNVRDAYQELIENWRRSIKKSFDLQSCRLDVVREEKTEGSNMDIVYKVQCPDSDPPYWLGYIHYQATDDYGSIDITNRAATLQPSHIGAGGTRKTGNGNQACPHDKGLKAALHVLMRNPHNLSVRCRSGQFNWRFNLTTRGQLVARLNRVAPEEGAKAIKDTQRLDNTTLLPFVAKSDEDVQFVIGETGQDDDGKRGGPARSVQVSRADFEAWTNDVLPLRTITDPDAEFPLPFVRGFPKFFY